MNVEEYIRPMEGSILQKRRDAELAADMLGLPKKYAERAARVLQLMEPRPRESVPVLFRPKDVYLHLRGGIGRAKVEHLVGLYLDCGNRLIAQELIGKGSVNTVGATPREIFFPAVANLAVAVILAHNHPSGNLEPSEEDIAFTRAVSKAGDLLGITLHDHIIVTRTGFTSLRGKGVI